MAKKILLLLNLLTIFFITSCADLLKGGYGKNNLTFEVGSAADSIERTVIGNPETTELKIECGLLRGEVLIKKESKIVKLSQLSNTDFSLTNIPNGNNYFISLDVYYKDYLIYTALSERIILNELNENAAVRLSLKQNNSKITYELNGGEFVPGQKVFNEYFINSKATFPVPVKAHYNFDGWYSSKDFNSDSKITELGQSCFLGDVTLYAKWIKLDQVSTVTITPDSGKFDLGDKITLKTSTPDAKIYYTTNGTVPDTTSNLYDISKNITITESMIKNDKVQIKAIAVKEGIENSDISSKIFTQNKYTITFDANGHGTAPDNISGKKKGEKIVLPSLNENNYTFENWQLNGTAVNNPYTVTGDVTLVANWTAKGALAKVNFIPSQQLDSAGTIDFGETITLSCTSPHDKIYYTTDGSDPSLSSNSGRIEYTSPISMENDVTIKAVAEKAGQSPSEVAEATYKIRKYTVTLDNNGHGNLVESVFENKKKGDKIDLPSLNEIDFTFENWLLNGAVVRSPYTVTGNVTLTANWSAIEALAKVEFATSQPLDGEGSIDFGETITLSCTSSPDKIYYTTDGSDPSLSSNLGRIEYISPITMENDVTIKAVAEKAGQSPSEIAEAAYKLRKYTVTFKANGHGTAPQNLTTLKRNDTLTEEQLKMDDANLGAIFLNWTDADRNEISAGHIITKSLVLTANWNDIAPGDVTNLVIKPDYNKVTLTWTAPNVADYKGVIITYDNGKTVEVAKGTSTTDITGLTNCTEYSFTVQSEDNAGQRSAGVTKSLYVMRGLTEKPKVLTDYTAPHPPASGSWTYVEFGDWPQTELPEKQVNSTLKDTTTTVNINGWTCYYGKDGEYYIQAEVGLPKKNCYFKLEPIKWRVLADNYIDADGTSTNRKLLFAEKLLYSSCQSVSTNEPYDNSDIRQTLKNDFYPKAFTADAQKLIEKTKVKNKDSFDKQTVATEDYAFLLSIDELQNTSYGFSSTYGYESDGATDSSRIREQTDYNKKVYNKDDSTYWTRSVNTEIGPNGGNGGNGATKTVQGVVPAITLKANYSFN